MSENKHSDDESKFKSLVDVYRKDSSDQRKIRETMYTCMETLGTFREDLRSQAIV